MPLQPPSSHPPQHRPGRRQGLGVRVSGDRVGVAREALRPECGSLSGRGLPQLCSAELATRVRGHGGGGGLSCTAEWLRVWGSGGAPGRRVGLWGRGTRGDPRGPVSAPQGPPRPAAPGPSRSISSTLTTTPPSCCPRRRRSARGRAWTLSTSRRPTRTRTPTSAPTSSSCPPPRPPCDGTGPSRA